MFYTLDTLSPLFIHRDEYREHSGWSRTSPKRTLFNKICDDYFPHSLFICLDDEYHYATKDFDDLEFARESRSFDGDVLFTRENLEISYFYSKEYYDKLATWDRSSNESTKRTKWVILHFEFETDLAKYLLVTDSEFHYGINGTGKKLFNTDHYSVRADAQSGLLHDALVMQLEERGDEIDANN